jgi:hypothetical protein
MTLYSSKDKGSYNHQELISFVLYDIISDQYLSHCLFRNITNFATAI